MSKTLTEKLYEVLEDVCYDCAKYTILKHKALNKEEEDFILSKLHLDE